MTIIVTPTEDDIFTTLRIFLLDILPSGTEVIQGQINRVAEPHVEDFVVMTPTLRQRIETNVDNYVDALFVGSITGTVLTITGVQYGELKVGSKLFGTGVFDPTTISSFGTATGSVGTYNVSKSQNAASQAIAAGVLNALQPVQMTFQLDVHGPNSSDNAHRISTLLRDDYAVGVFAATGVDLVPLYADDPRQMPFVNAEDQYEDRWIVSAVLQANQVVLDVPQQFADQLSVSLINVEAAYPA